MFNIHKLRGLLSPLGQLLLLLAVGGVGAALALLLKAPIPYLIGSLVSTAIFSAYFFKRTRRKLWYPEALRTAFVGVVGIMIGSTFTPDIFDIASVLVITLPAMVVFVAVTWVVNFQLFYRFAGFSHPTSVFAAMPGGLIEAVVLGEAHGADAPTISVQQFVRLILVVLAVPLLFYLWTGQQVGSITGQSLGTGPSRLIDWAAFLVLVPVGVLLGKLLRLPAALLTGPLLLSAAIHASNLWHLNSPGVLLAIAQLIIGAGLGSKFAALSLSSLATSIGYGIISVSFMILVGVGFSLTLVNWAPFSLNTLLVSFAPGGVTEMSLVALSLGINPVLVATHHMFRVLFCITVGSIFSRRYYAKFLSDKDI